MKKLLIPLGFLVGTALAHDMGKMHRWCEQNWEKCKELKLSHLKLREKYLPKERECVEKANSFQEMRTCMMGVKEEKRKEMQELYKGMMHKE